MKNLFISFLVFLYYYVPLEAVAAANGGCVIPPGFYHGKEAEVEHKCILNEESKSSKNHADERKFCCPGFLCDAATETCVPNFPYYGPPVGPKQSKLDDKEHSHLRERDTTAKSANSKNGENKKRLPSTRIHLTPAEYAATSHLVLQQADAMHRGLLDVVERASQAVAVAHQQLNSLNFYDNNLEEDEDELSEEESLNEKYKRFWKHLNESLSKDMDKFRAFSRDSNTDFHEFLSSLHVHDLSANGEEGNYESEYDNAASGSAALDPQNDMQSLPPLERVRCNDTHCIVPKKQLHQHSDPASASSTGFDWMQFIPKGININVHVPDQPDDKSSKESDHIESKGHDYSNKLPEGKRTHVDKADESAADEEVGHVHKETVDAIHGKVKGRSLTESSYANGEDNGGFDWSIYIPNQYSQTSNMQSRPKSMDKEEGQTSEGEQGKQFNWRQYLPFSSEGEEDADTKQSAKQQGKGLGNEMKEKYKDENKGRKVDEAEGERDLKSKKGKKDEEDGKIESPPGGSAGGYDYSQYIPKQYQQYTNPNSDKGGKGTNKKNAAGSGTSSQADYKKMYVQNLEANYEALSSFVNTPVALYESEQDKRDWEHDMDNRYAKLKETLKQNSDQIGETADDLSDKVAELADVLAKKMTTAAANLKQAACDLRKKAAEVPPSDHTNKSPQVQREYTNLGGERVKQKLYADVAKEEPIDVQHVGMGEYILIGLLLAGVILCLGTMFSRQAGYRQLN